MVAGKYRKDRYEFIIWQRYIGFYKLEQTCFISELAYLYEAYELEQACTISEMAYLYEAYKLVQACTISKMAYLYRVPTN